MKLKKIFLKSIIVTIVIITVILFTNIAHAIRTDNAVPENQMSTRTVPQNAVEETDVADESGIMPINETYGEDSKMVLELGSMQIDKYEGNKEISLPITVKNANLLCGGIIVVNYTGLEYIGIENQNSDYVFSEVNNQEESKLVINCFSTAGHTGDISLVNLKFSLPDEIEDDKYFNVNIMEESSLITMTAETIEHSLVNSQIHIVKGNVSNFDITKTVIIAAALVVVIMVLFIVIKKVKSKK